MLMTSMPTLPRLESSRSEFTRDERIEFGRLLRPSDETRELMRLSSKMGQISDRLTLARCRMPRDEKRCRRLRKLLVAWSRRYDALRDKAKAVTS